MRALTGCLVVMIAAGGCATRQGRPLDVSAEAPGPASGEIVQQTVALRHTDQGWVTVEFEGSEAVAWHLDEDARFLSGVGPLPTGRYDAVRIQYLTAVPAELGAEPGARGPSEVAWVATEALVHEDFCIGSTDPHLALQVLRDGRNDRMSARVTLAAPCPSSPAPDREPAEPAEPPTAVAAR